VEPLIAEDVSARLPRGRHAMTRSEVGASQRARLLRAMIDEVAERGYAATTATGVYQRAGVSSRAFYENFTDVRDCFLTAYDECVGLAQAALGADRPATRPDPLAAFARMLETYLRLLGDNPNIARTFLVEVYSAGPEARQRRLQVHTQFVTGVTAVLAPRRRLHADDVFALESLVDAITFRVTRALLDDSLQGGLDRLRDELVRLTQRLCPWLEERGHRG
jgi:AcrR family transcriptional regulator